MAHWSDAYVGLPYVEGGFDCGDLARKVRAEVFDQAISLPSERLYVGLSGVAKVRAMHRQIELCRDDCATPTAMPRDGDGVLIQANGYIDHIGIYCLINGEPWVLHAALDARQVIRTRLRELPLYGYRVEGFYQWK